jgi:hypothetical protein
MHLTRITALAIDPKKAGRSVALSGAIGFILVALLLGMIIGGAVTLSVIAPSIESHFQTSSNQGSNSNQNSNYQNNNNQGPTVTPNNPNVNNQNPNPNNNGYNNQMPTPTPTGNNNQNNNQTNNYNNDNSSQGINNINPPIANPTGHYSSIGSQLYVVTSQNGAQMSGTITASINCLVQQNGNSIQLDMTITPTSVPQSLNQAIDSTPATFNFAGTTSGSQINAQASGTTGGDSTGPNFSLNLSGSFNANTLTITVSSGSNSQISVSTPQPITLQSS